MTRPFPKDHPGPDVWAPVAEKSPKPHIRVMSRDCGNPDCPCQLLLPAQANPAVEVDP